MYEILKTIHVLAVVIFLGNIITGLFWKAHADRVGDIGFMHHTMDGIIRADRIFTVPGVVVIVGAGVWAAIRGGLPMLGTGWILWSIILFTISGIAFMWKVGPLQRELLAITAQRESFDESLYRSKSLAWEIWGGIAAITPVIAVVLMVLKRPL